METKTLEQRMNAWKKDKKTPAKKTRSPLAKSNHRKALRQKAKGK